MLQRRAIVSKNQVTSSLFFKKWHGTGKYCGNETVTSSYKFRTYSDNHINSNRNNAIHISCLYSGIEAEELITKIQFSRVSGACMQIFVSFFTFSGQKRGHLYLKTPSIPPTALSETLGTIVSHPFFHFRNEMK